MRYIIHYRAEIRFALVLAFLVAISIWASEYIPGEYFDGVITPVLMTAATAVSLTFAWAISRHTDGYRLRRVWAWTLLLWGLADGTWHTLAEVKDNMKRLGVHRFDARKVSAVKVQVEATWGAPSAHIQEIRVYGQEAK